MATNNRNIKQMPVSLVLQNIAGAFNRFSDEYDEATDPFVQMKLEAKLDACKYLHDYFKEHYGN